MAADVAQFKPPTCRTVSDYSCSASLHRSGAATIFLYRAPFIAEPCLSGSAPQALPPVITPCCLNDPEKR